VPGPAGLPPSHHHHRKPPALLHHCTRHADPSPHLHKLTCRRPSRLVTGRRLEKPLELAGAILAGKISLPEPPLAAYK
jgi:hypothetical protein